MFCLFLKFNIYMQLRIVAIHLCKVRYPDVEVEAEVDVPVVAEAVAVERIEGEYVSVVAVTLAVKMIKWENAVVAS